MLFSFVAMVRLNRYVFLELCSIYNSFPSDFKSLPKLLNMDLAARNGSYSSSEVVTALKGLKSAF